MPSLPRHAIGIDLGGTKIEALLLDPAGHERWRRRVPTPQGDYPATLQAVAALVAQARSIEGAAAATVGLGHPGSTARDGRLKNANSTCLNGQPMQADLQALLGGPLAMANDANCLALSEAHDGAAAGAEVVFAVILGTGIGGGIAVRGQVLSGPNGLAGEWGHNPLPWAEVADGEALPCYCGQRGCIETWCSGPALAALHAREQGLPPQSAPDAVTLAAAAAAGDTAAAHSIARWQHRLARALAGVINLLDPDAIVLGGGLSRIAGLADAIRALWGRWIFSAGAGDPPRTRLAIAQHGDSSGVRGAAWLGAGLSPDRQQG